MLYYRFFNIRILGISFRLIGCNRTPVVDTRIESEALRSIENQWVEDARAGDIEAILSNYAPDAVDMGYNMPISVDQMSRRKGIESWLAGIDLKSIKNTTDDIQVSSSGDLAFTRGTSHYNKTTPDGLIEYSDKWVTVYKKTGGKWKVIVNISNSDNPLPAPVLKNN